MLTETSNYTTYEQEKMKAKLNTTLMYRTAQLCRLPDCFQIQMLICDLFETLLNYMVSMYGMCKRAFCKLVWQTENAYRPRTRKILK